MFSRPVADMDLPVALLLVLALQQRSRAGHTYLRLNQGTVDCKDEGGGEGKCMPTWKCKYHGDLNSQSRPICYFKGKQPIVCCPQTRQVGSKIIAHCKKMESNCRQTSSGINHRQKIYLPSSTVTEVQRTNLIESDNSPTAAPKGRNKQIEGRVAGGRQSLPRKRKYMVLIGYGTNEPNEWPAAGSLITSNFVLSAAHCAYLEGLGPARRVRVGELVISSSDDDAKPQDKEIAQIIVHPSYTNRTLYHDIALFRLKESVQINPWVELLCLQIQPKITFNTATISGWGKQEYAKGTSDSLLEAELDVFNDTECRSLLPSRSNKTPRGIDSRFMFCAGKRDGTKDACTGDSGGPLVTKSSDSCLFTQIGIISYGNMCGVPNSPGVYTRISNYIPWIERIAFANPNDL